MKDIIKILAILLIVNCSLVVSVRILPVTPKAADLSDHFGSEPVKNVYGPHNVGVARLVREGITGEATPITPIRNFSKEINPDNVVSGDLLNTSYDASKIIKPEIAGNFLLTFSS
jgi:hypothetical protein